MRQLYVPMFVIAILVTTPTLADNNASGGDVVTSEIKDLGAGPFDHGQQTIGSADNSVVSGISFTGGFTATHVRFAGTATSVIATTWGSEADIQIRQGALSFNWQNPGPGSAYTTFDYDFGRELTGDFIGGVDPGVGGSWDVEFFDSFSDGAGADSQSTNVSMTFEARTPIVDSNGVWMLNSLNVGGTSTSTGEFAVASLFDTYDITLNEAGLFTFFTGPDPNGFVGSNVDTEIAIFDSSGMLVAGGENPDIGGDDGGPFGADLYSGFEDLSLAAGDYTIAVAPFLGGDSFDNGFVVNPGVGTGDYTITASLKAVPEPGTLAFLGFGCCGLLAYRRRK